MIRCHIMWPPFGGRPFIDKELDKDSEEYKTTYKLNRHLLQTYEALTDKEIYALQTDSASKETRLKVAMIALLEAIDVINQIRDANDT